MREYPKIQTLFQRDMSKNGALLEGNWTEPEFGYLQNNVWDFTEKVDGTNIRIGVGTTVDGFQDSHQDVVIGGRTEAAQIPATLLTVLRQKFTLETLNKAFDWDTLPNVVLFGEGYGAKIQKGGGNYRQDQDFVLFDVLVGDWWLQRKDVVGVACKLGIDVVPLIGVGTLREAIEKAREGFNSQWGNFLAEGIVMRPTVELKTRSGKRIIAKIKHRDFIQGKGRK